MAWTCLSQALSPPLFSCLICLLEPSLHYILRPMGVSTCSVFPLTFCPLPPPGPGAGATPFMAHQWLILSLSLDRTPSASAASGQPLFPLPQHLWLYLQSSLRVGSTVLPCKHNDTMHVCRFTLILKKKGGGAEANPLYSIVLPANQKSRSLP